MPGGSRPRPWSLSGLGSWFCPLRLCSLRHLMSTSCVETGFTIIPASWPAEDSMDLPGRLAPRQHECAGAFILPSCWSRLLSTRGFAGLALAWGQETGAPCAGTLDYHCSPRASALPPVNERRGWRRGTSDSACSLHLHTGHSPGQARTSHALCMAQDGASGCEWPLAEGDHSPPRIPGPGTGVMMSQAMLLMAALSSLSFQGLEVGGRPLGSGVPALSF